MKSFVLYSYEFKGLYVFDPTIEETDLVNVDVNQSVAQKQDIFESFFSTENFPEHFTKGKRSYGCQLLWKAQHIIVIRIENKRTIKRDKNFKTDEIDTYPWVEVIIDNRKDVQHIAILRRPKAFSNSDTVAEIIQDTLNHFLRQSRLSISIDAQYHSCVFWNLLKKYRQYGIKRIQFNFAFPNKDWATEMMGELAELSQNANGDAQLGFEARKEETLTFSESVQKNRDLVNACSGTGQDILIKPNNHATIHTRSKKNPVEKAMNDTVLKDLEDNKFNQAVFGHVQKFCDACQPYYDV